MVMVTGVMMRMSSMMGMIMMMLINTATALFGVFMRLIGMPVVFRIGIPFKYHIDIQSGNPIFCILFNFYMYSLFNLVCSAVVKDCWSRPRSAALPGHITADP